MKRFQNNSDNGNSEYLNIQQLSQYLGIKESTLYSLVEQRKIPHYKIGRLVRFKKSEIDLWMESQKKGYIDVSKVARKALKPLGKPVRDVNKLVKKTIEEVTGVVYTSSHGKPDQVKGLGKEVHDGSV